MQRVWHRKFDGFWYATFTEGSAQKQLKLIKGPKDKAHKKLAEEQLLKELKSRKPRSKKVAPDWLVVNGVLRGFLRHSRKNHEPSTYRWYKDILKGFNRLYGRLRVTQLRRRHVTRWFEKSGYNPTSQNRALGALKRAFNWAVEEEYLVENPIAHVRKPKSLVRDRILTADERTLILTSIKGQAFRDFVAGNATLLKENLQVLRINEDFPPFPFSTAWVVGKPLFLAPAIDKSGGDADCLSRFLRRHQSHAAPWEKPSVAFLPSMQIVTPWQPHGCLPPAPAESSAPVSALSSSWRAVDGTPSSSRTGF